MTIYKCHNWVFNPQNQEIVYDDGQVKQLPGRISSCLNTLLESRGETVLYEQLLMRVWGTTHKDPSTVSSVISELRKTIGCGRDKVKLLHTVPKRGYRFIGEVEVVNDSPQQPPAIKRASIADNLGHWAAAKAPAKAVEQSATVEAAVSDVVAPVGQKSMVSPKALMLVLFGILISISASILSSNLLNLEHDGPFGGLGRFERLETLTHDAGSELEFDVDSTGQWLIYTQLEKGSTDKIVAKNLDTGEQVMMPAEPDVSYRSPSFSPDLSKVAYVKNSPKACEIWLIGFNQGVFDEQSNRRVSRCGLSGFWTTTDFSHDGHSVYFSRSDSLNDPFRIYRHDLRTGYERNLTAPTSSGRGDYAFSVSPDGKKLAIIRNKQWQATRILVKNLEDDSITSIDEVPYLLRRVAWYSNQQLVYFGQDWQLWSFDMSNKEKKVVADLKQPMNFPVFAGDRLFTYRGLIYNAAIWSIEHRLGKPVELSKVIDSPYKDFSPVLADALQLFFLSNRSGTVQLWHKENNRYTKYPGPPFPIRVNSLHYSERHQSLFGVSEMRIFRYDPKLQKIQWLTAENQPIHNLSLSDDGRLIYAVDIGEQWQLRQYDIDSGHEKSFEIDAFSAHLQQDTLYFTRYRTSGLWKLALNEQEPTLLVEQFNGLLSNYWDVSGEKIFQVDENVLHIFSTEDGRSLAEPKKLDGLVKNIQCHRSIDACLIDLFQAGETEVVELR